MVRPIDLVAGKRRKPEGFVGDKILSTYQLLASLCGLSFLSLLAVASFGVAWKPAILGDLQKQYPGEAWHYLMNPKYTATLGGIIVLWIVFGIWWTIATWRGRRWAIGLHLFFSGLGAACGIALGAEPSAYIVPCAIAIYCLLRLTGHAGPKKVRRAQRAT